MVGTIVFPENTATSVYFIYICIHGDELVYIFIPSIQLSDHVPLISRIIISVVTEHKTFNQ